MSTTEPNTNGNGPGSAPTSDMPDFSGIASSTAMVSPSAAEFDLLLLRLRRAVDAGRGEAIVDVGVPAEEDDSGR